jgi:hypothetical protein
LSKLESISSSAVRAADKVGASLIVVYTHTGEQHPGLMCEASALLNCHSSTTQRTRCTSSKACQHDLEVTQELKRVFHLLHSVD